MSAWLDHALQEPGCTRAASIPLREFNQTLELEHLQRPASPADAGPWASAGGSCAGVAPVIEKEWALRANSEGEAAAHRREACCTAALALVASSWDFWNRMRDGDDGRSLISRALERPWNAARKAAQAVLDRSGPSCPWDRVRNGRHLVGPTPPECVALPRVRRVHSRRAPSTRERHGRSENHRFAHSPAP